MQDNQDLYRRSVGREFLSEAGCGRGVRWSESPGERMNAEMIKDGKSSEGRGVREPSSERSQAWARLAARYLRDLPRQLDGIRTTLKIKDYSAIKKQAHRIKGTSGTYRFEDIAKGAARLERLADTENAEAIVTTINKVMRLVELEAKKVNSQLVSSSGKSEGDING